MDIYDYRWKEPKEKKFKFKINTSGREIKDLLMAWLAITFAFTIASIGLSFSLVFLLMFLMSGLTVGIGFIAHELGHKIVAQRNGCFAEFRAFPQMLIFGIIFAFFGFVFAAPGAVMIGGHVTRKKSGKIAAAGPLTNLVLAAIFFSLLSLFPIGFFRYAFKINTWLALFNLIPFGGFDGLKVLIWNRKIYFAIIIASLVFFFL